MKHIKSATNSRNEACRGDTDKLDEVLNSDKITNIDRDKYTDESLKSLDEAIEKEKKFLIIQTHLWKILRMPRVVFLKQQET